MIPSATAAENRNCWDKTRRRRLNNQAHHKILPGFICQVFPRCPFRPIGGGPDKPGRRKPILHESGPWHSCWCYPQNPAQSTDCQMLYFGLLHTGIWQKITIFEHCEFNITMITGIIAFHNFIHLKYSDYWNNCQCW